ncbi:MAG: NAD(P)H-dependent oxidoreductase [Xanthobacteraceae bacterium]
MSAELKIVVCSTRPNRVGLPIGRWFHNCAIENGKFNAELIDLATVNLPIYDEPKHPSLQQYEHGHTKKWATIVSAADAYVLVTPEYNYGPPPALINALNYVYKEWNYKPVAFVSNGGVSGGTRAVQMEKQILTTLKVVPIFEAVVIPVVAQNMNEGQFHANEVQKKAAVVLLDELFRWAEALKVLRQ